MSSGSAGCRHSWHRSCQDESRKELYLGKIRICDTHPLLPPGCTESLGNVQLLINNGKQSWSCWWLLPGFPPWDKGVFSIPLMEWRCLECAGWDAQLHPGHPSPLEHPLEFHIFPLEAHYPINIGVAPGDWECHWEGADPCLGAEGLILRGLPRTFPAGWM